MNKDAHLIFEAYAKKLTESELPRLSPVKPIGAEKEIKYTHSKNDEPSQPYVTYTLNGTGKNVYFYYDKDGNFLRGLIKGGSTSGLDLKTFKKEDIEKIATEHKLTPEVFHKAIEEGGQKVKTHHSTSENAEESREITMKDIIQAIEKTLKPSRGDASITYCYLGEVYDQLEKMGFKMYGQYGENTPRAQFEKLWDNDNDIEKDKSCFLGQNAYSYDPNCGYDYDRPYEKPSFDKYGNGPYLFMEGSEDGPDVWTACEFAKEHGYKKVILNGLS